MSYKETFLKDKPYSFVPLINTCTRKQIDKHNVFNKKNYSGRITLKFTVKSLLHIGCGQAIINKNGEYEILTAKRNGVVIIPGKSIKGAIRTIAEAVSSSCAVKIPDKNKDLKKALPDENKEQCKLNKELCEVCSIFGMTNGNKGYKGKVSFGEFRCKEVVKTVKEKITNQQSPFKDYPEKTDENKKLKITSGNERLYYCKACYTGNSINRNYDNKCNSCSKSNYYNEIKLNTNRTKLFRGRKFYYSERESAEVKNESNEKSSFYEMIPIDIALYGDIILRNITENELSLLMYSLNINNNFQLVLGYGKKYKYGKVKVEIENVEDMNNRYNLINNTYKKLTKDKLKELAKKHKENSSGEVLAAIEKLEEILEYRNGKL